MKCSAINMVPCALVVALAGCGGAPYGGDGSEGGSAGAAGSGGAGGSAGAGASGGAAGAGGAAGSGASGGTAGTGGSGGTTPTCDEAASPADEACVIDDELAVFVSPAGGVAAAGTQADPLGSVQAGLTKAKADGKRLFVCADGGDFAENVSLGAALAGVEVWGGFKCDGWGFDAGLKATVAPASGVPLTATDIHTETSFQFVRFVAPAGVAPGDSSVGGFISESSALSFEQVEFAAQGGVSGAAGTRVDVSAPSPSAITGQGASGNDAGASRSFTCADTGEMTRGARGGDGAPAEAGGDGLPAITVPNPNGGKGGELGADCAEGGSGRSGNPGAAGSVGAGAATLGTLSASGWAPQAGASGGFGGVAQGGGGGRGGATGGGGGGGAGGCGGAPGGAGGGGGASVALLLFNAPVTLKDVQLTTGDAGDGGDGADGQGGLDGGEAGGRIGSGCDGGTGGRGGAGGGGGGGAGGVSAGVLHLGAAPVREGGGVSLGAPGAAGGSGSSGSTAGSGVPGQAAEVLSLNP